MEEKELIELYIQRNTLAKSSNMEEANKITEDINNKLPTKLPKRGFKDSDGNVVQFEIIWTTDRGGDGMLDDIKLPHTRYDAPVVNGKGMYKRILIKRLSTN